MESFAFILNTIAVRQSKGFWPRLRINFNRFRVFKIEKIRSIRKKEINGFFIVCPPEKTLDAALIAERLDPKVIGLNGCASYAAKLRIPVTCGAALTSWSVFEAIYRIAKVNKIDLKKSNLLVLGATNLIGNLCAKKLADYVGSITIEGDVREAVKNADIIINAGNSPELEFTPEDIKSNTIVCDVSLSGDIFKKLKARQDITVIKAGLIKLPYPVKLKINTGLPPGIVSAPMAETILLALEEKFVSYSSGDNINVDSLEEIADIAARHGFEIWVPEAPVM
jgi:fatty aldehyde-generating acyl-ACP reductase